MTDRDPVSASPGGGSATPDRILRLADALVEVAAGSVRGVILYGSHLLGARPDAHSAVDFVVVVSDYRAFYGALHDRGEIHRPLWIFTTLARVLPPNVIAFTPGDGEEGIAKCLVVDEADLARALGPQPPDHMLLARLVQRVSLVRASGEDAGEWIAGLLRDARAGVLRWVGPWLDQPFDADSVGRKLLEICYGAELRPESRDRSATIFDAQRDHFRATLGPLLERKARDGELEIVEGGYRFVSPPGPRERRRWARHFTRSKVRATLRWFKYMLTFDNWLPYVHRKAERRLGRRIELTRLERRWPILFLWPRAVRVLLSRPEREGDQ